MLKGSQERWSLLRLSAASEKNLESGNEWAAEDSEHEQRVSYFVARFEFA